MPQIVRSADGQVWIEVTQVDRVENAARQLADRQEARARAGRWRELLRTSPVQVNEGRVCDATAALRNVGRQVATNQIRIVEAEHLAMSLLCDAIAAGALRGPKYLAFRNRITAHPHWCNAVMWLLKWDEARPSPSPSECLTLGCAAV